MSWHWLGPGRTPFFMPGGGPPTIASTMPWIAPRSAALSAPVGAPLPCRALTMLSSLGWMNPGGSTYSVPCTSAVYPPCARAAAARHALSRHEQQVLVDGDVALRCGAEVPDLQPRLLRVRNVPDLIAVVVPMDGVGAGERQVGVGDPGEFLGRPRFRDYAQVPGGFAGVHLSRAQADAPVGGGRRSGHIELRRGAGGEGQRDGRERQRQRRSFHCGLRWKASSMRFMRSISVVWSAYTSEANR